MKIIAYAILRNKKRDWGYTHKFVPVSLPLYSRHRPDIPVPCS